MNDENCGQGVELLIVEDSPQDLELAVRALKKANFTNKIHVARDGAEALDFIFGGGAYAGRKPEEAPRLILLDLKLPKVDGLEVLLRVKSDPRTRSIPVVILTSSREKADIERCFFLGANSYVVKPVDYSQFKDTIKQLGSYWQTINVLPTNQ